MERERPDFSFLVVGLLEGEAFDADAFGLISGAFFTAALGSALNVLAGGDFLRILAAGLTVFVDSLD
jgi:hypothetical protein